MFFLFVSTTGDRFSGYATFMTGTEITFTTIGNKCWMAMFKKLRASIFVFCPYLDNFGLFFILQEVGLGPYFFPAPARSVISRCTKSVTSWCLSWTGRWWFPASKLLILGGLMPFIWIVHDCA